MGRRKDSDETFTGKFNVKKFKEAVKDMAEKNQLTDEQINSILVAAIDKAARDTLYPNQKTTNSKDMHSETIIDTKSGEISFYECKDVLEDDDIEDDLYQISVEDAKEDYPNIKVGDVWKHKVDLASLDFAFFTRTIQNFHQKVREATKEAMVQHYSSYINQIINCVVERTNTYVTTVSIGNIIATLNNQNSIPDEKFIPGSTIKVLVKGIGENRDSSDKTPSLIISRTDPTFLRRLFELYIPDITDKYVEIKDIVRDPGNRAKVSVFASNPDIDPTGACIGSDGSRIKEICSEIANEKIDVIKWYANPYLYIAEALKPANVVGVAFSSEAPEEGKFPKATAIVKNNESKVAIGKKGVNVRLASKLTGYSIDVKELDDAMAQHISYTNIDDIRRKNALDTIDLENKNIPDLDEEEEELLVDSEAEEIVPEVEKADEIKEEVKQEPKQEKLEEVKQEVKPVEEEKVEHVEITSKAKVSLDKLEAEIEAEKKKKQSPAPSYKKAKKEEKEEKKVITPAVNAMPIYTEEEIQAMEEEEEQDNYQDEDEYSEYDDDEYYDDEK